MALSCLIRQRDGGFLSRDRIEVITGHKKTKKRHGAVGPRGECLDRSGRVSIRAQHFQVARRNGVAHGLLPGGTQLAAAAMCQTRPALVRS